MLRVLLMLALVLVVLQDFHLLFWNGNVPSHKIVPLIDVHDQPEMRAEYEPASFAEGIRTALAEARYGDLETLAAVLRDPDRRFRGGTSQITRFYEIVTEVQRLPTDKPCNCTLDPDSFEAKKAQLEAWFAAMPAQQTSSVALAALWAAAAWSARGTEYADKVTDEQWTKMRESFVQARRYFAQIDFDQDPIAYDEIIYMGMVEGWDRETLDAFYAQAIKSDPTYYNHYARRAEMLQQKWGGRPGELAGYLDTLAAPERGVDGQIAYAFAAYRLIVADNRLDVIESDVLDFRKITTAYQAREQRFGLRPHDWKALFYFALHSGMTVSAIQAFQRMGTDWDSGIWWTREYFEQDVKWYKANIESLAWAAK